MKIKSLVATLRKLWNTQRALCVVWMGVGAYTFVFSAVSFVRYDAFSFNDFDFAMYVHENWKIAHGNSLSSIFNNTPIWGVYLELISYVVTPFFVLCNYHPKSLLFLQSLILGMGAVPVYLIAREKLSSTAAVVLAFAYLVYAPLWYTNLYEYYPVVFSTLMFLLMFYFMEKRRFVWFALFLLLTLLIRVDMAMTTFMYGAYALWGRKPWKWVVFPCLISGLWLYVGLIVVIPKFQGNLNFAQITYAYLGKNFPEVFHNIIRNPDLWWGVVCSASSRDFVFQILMPLLFLPLLAFREFAL